MSDLCHCLSRSSQYSTCGHIVNSTFVGSLFYGNLIQYRNISLNAISSSLKNSNCTLVACENAKPVILNSVAPGDRMPVEEVIRKVFDAINFCHYHGNNNNWANKPVNQEVDKYWQV